MVGKIEGKRRGGQPRMRGLDSITDSMDMNFNKFQEIVCPDDSAVQYYCLENPMDRGVWWVIVHRIIMSQTEMSMEYVCTGK